MFANLTDDPGRSTSTSRTHLGGSFPYSVVTTPPTTPTRQRAPTIPVSPRSQLSAFDSPGSAANAALPSTLELQMCERIQALAAEAECTKQHMMTVNEYLETQQVELDNYRAQLRESKKDVRFSKPREASHTAFLNELVALLKQHGHQGLHDTEETPSSDIIRNSCLDGLACDLALLQQAGQLFSTQRSGQNDTALTRKDHITTIEPEAEEDVEVHEDVDHEVRRDIEHEIEQDCDVKRTSEQLQSPYRVPFNPGPIPTDWDHDHGSRIDGTHCEPFEVPPPGAMPKVPKLKTISYKKDGIPYFACDGNVDWTTSESALSKTDLTEPMQRWFITAGGAKIYRWATPSRTYSRTLMSWQTLPADASFEDHHLRIGSSYGPA